MACTLIAACGGPLVARLRKTFPVTPDTVATVALHRRGRLLSHGDLTVAELPPVMEAGPDPVGTDVTAELAFYLGSCPECTAVLMVIPAPQLTLADRIIAPGQRELVPDLLEPSSRIVDSVEVATIENPAVWVTAQWALRRLGPHQFWVVGLPVKPRRRPGGEQADGDATAGYSATPPTDRAIHRGLRSVVMALEEQNR